ncbi:hypothetical protein AB0C77_01030 [Streptomyces sp. NPDC048629]|uniref:hypothetical protein n=1 Tax=Streptomyces sp. NPDC048629 TaxID=3154824 RepID=UPI003416B413
MSTPERETRATEGRRGAVTMVDLLASCAAADAVSTPPREVERETEPEAQGVAEPVVRQEAA